MVVVVVVYYCCCCWCGVVWDGVVRMVAMRRRGVRVCFIMRYKGNSRPRLAHNGQTRAPDSPRSIEMRRAGDL